MSRNAASTRLLQIVLMMGDWRNMYLRPYKMQNVMNAFLAVMIFVPLILLAFCLASFAQDAIMRDVSNFITRSVAISQN